MAVRVMAEFLANLKDESGAMEIEYGLIAALVSVELDTAAGGGS